MIVISKYLLWNQDDPSEVHLALEYEHGESDGPASAVKFNGDVVIDQKALDSY